MRGKWSVLVVAVFALAGSGARVTPSSASPREKAQPKITIADVFVHTSVRRHRLFADVTLRNEGDSAAEAFLRADIADPVGEGGHPPSIAPKTVSLGAGASQLVRLQTGWVSPRLWSPEDPYLYQLGVSLDTSQPQDAFEKNTVRFGFREVWVEDGQLRLNDVPFHSRGDVLPGAIAREGVTRDLARWYLETARQMNVTTVHVPAGDTPDWLLDMTDEMGMLVVRDAAAPDDVRRWRGHPSIMAWVIPERTDGAVPSGLVGLIRQADPSRPIICDHASPNAADADIVSTSGYEETHWRPALAPEWVSGSAQKLWPGKALAITAPPTQGGPWVPFGAAAYAGDSVYSGLLAADSAYWRAEGDLLRMQVETYRAEDVAHVEPWQWGAWAIAWPPTGTGPRAVTGVWEAGRKAYAPIAAFVAERTHNFESGKGLTPTVTVYNDTLRPAELELSCQVIIGEQARVPKVHNLTLDPGEHKSVKVLLPLPEVRERTAATVRVEVRRKGKLQFEDERPIAVFPPATKVQTGPREVILYDPVGTTLAALSREGIAFLSVPDLSEAALSRFAPGEHVLVLGDGALTEETPLGAVSEWTRAGGVMLSFAQVAIPEDTPFEVWAEPGDTVTACARRTGHPALLGVQGDDLRYWRDDGVVARGAVFGTGTHFGAVADDYFGFAMVEARAGDGLTLYTQLAICDKSEKDPAARRILKNVLEYVTSWQPPMPERAALLAAPESTLATACGLLGVDAAPVDEPNDLRRATRVIVDASAPWTPDLRDAVAKVAGSGGQVLLHGLTPESAAAWIEVLPVPLAPRPTALRHQQLEVERPTPAIEGVANGDLLWQWEPPGLGTTPPPPRIVDFVMDAPPGAEALIVEPRLTAAFPPERFWDDALRQAMLEAVPIEPPGAAVLWIPTGKGGFLVDQIRWDAAILKRPDAWDIGQVLLGNLGARPGTHGSLEWPGPSLE